MPGRPVPTDLVGNRLFVRSRKIVRTILQSVEDVVSYKCYLLCGSFPWQSIFPSANITPNTTKTVGGESSPTVFTFKCALFYFTVYALFRELSLRKQNFFRKFFAKLFFKKASTHPLASSRPRAPRVPCVPQASVAARKSAVRASRSLLSISGARPPTGIPSTWLTGRQRVPEEVTITSAAFISSSMV